MARIVERVVAGIVLKINGAAVTAEVLRDLIEVTVQEDISQSSVFTIKLHSWDMDRRVITWADDALFALGNTVEISPGYAGDTFNPVVYGEITGLEVEYDIHSRPVLTVTGYDIRYRLTRGPKLRVYDGKTDSQIASQILQENKLSARVTPTTLVHEHETQLNETDLAYLNRLADRNGFAVSIQSAIVVFGPPSEAGVAPLPLSFEDQLLSFSASVTTTEMLGEIRIYDCADDTMAPFMASAKRSSFPGTLPKIDKIHAPVEIITDAEPDSRAEADEVAASRLDELARDCLTGSGQCHGDSALRAGILIRVDTLGKRFGGTYRLESVTHSYSPANGYRTRFSVKGVPT